MFRFSRDNRFYLPTSYEEFMRTSREVAEIATSGKLGARAEVLVLLGSSNRNDRYRSPTLEEELRKRKSFSLDEFTKGVWDRCSGAQLTVKTADQDDVFMVLVSWTFVQPSRLYFYGQAGADDGSGMDVEEQIMNRFAKGNLVTSIGEGFDGEDLRISKQSLSPGW